MEGGDISNAVAPRVLFVFEGLIGRPPVGNQAIKAKVSRKLHRWTNVVDAWDLDETMVKQMWDLVWRRNVQFDVVTFLYEESFAVALWKRLDGLGLPVSRVLWFDSPQHLARSLVYMPDVRTVFTADRSNAMAYGKVGRLVVDRSQDIRV